MSVETKNETAKESKINIDGIHISKNDNQIQTAEKYANIASYHHHHHH